MMKTSRKPKRKSKKSANKGMRYSTKMSPILDPKGHEVDRVYHRRKRGSNFVPMKHLYCEKCDKFFLFALKSVKVV